MTEDKTSKELPDWYPTDFGFSRMHYHLGSLIVDTAVVLDNQILGRAKEEDYAIVERLANILRDKSRDLRTYDSISHHNPDEYQTIKLFHDIYKPEERKMNKLAEMFAERLISLSEELRMSKQLPKEKVESLREFCCDLSRRVDFYWQQYNPTGFRNSLVA